MSAKIGTNLQQRGNSFQLRVTHPELPKGRYFTFKDQQEAKNYKETIDAWFARGQLPPELLSKDEVGVTPLVSEAIRRYLLSTNPAPAPSELPLIPSLEQETNGKRVADITFHWATDYVAKLKDRKLAPGTIRKRVDLMARILDHHFRQTHTGNSVMPANVMRLLPRGYSTYEKAEVTDKSRDNRLTQEQFERVVKALSGEKREDKERPWGNIKNGEKPDEAFALMFNLIVNTGMRLRECYTARVGDLNVEGKYLNVRGSKGHRGKIKWRTVPLVKSLYTELGDWCKDKDADALLFPYWRGDESDLDKCKSRLSARFGTLFDYALVSNFTEHDLRHEACCRWVSMRNSSGGWMFTESEICRIMGWTDPKLLLRYLSLRGEDLSARLH